MKYRYTATGAEFIDDENGFRPDGVEEFIDKRIYIPPYPPVWVMSTEGPKIGTEPSGPMFIKPYPPLWIMGENGPMIGIEPFHVGAFNGCYLCEEVVIPESVKFIGPYAFAGSGVKTVTIAEDCKYFPTSFPEGCHIKRY